MNPTLEITPNGDLLAVNEATATVATKSEFKKSATLANSLSRVWSSVRCTAEWFEGFAAVLALFYLLAAVALSGAVLFYTFSR